VVQEVSLRAFFSFPVFFASSRLMLIGTILKLSKRNHYVIQNHCASLTSSLSVCGASDGFLFALSSPFKRSRLLHSPIFIA
jgi:hypothetical protein